MKKIGKLSINPEKVIKDEELVNLRGGYGGDGVGTLCCFNWNHVILGPCFYGVECGGEADLTLCQSFYPSTHSAVCVD